MFEGERLGRRVKAQRACWPGLEEDQRNLLTAIGIEAARAGGREGRRRGEADSVPRQRFAQGLAALAQFVERERHPRIPRPHKEPVETVEAGPGGEEQVVVSHFALGTWLNNQEARRAKLTPIQLA
ncbi:hypothetical protein SAMN05216371_8292 [Streptomyces sp. TLI_053]|uniref:helicase associated domain-containing protein n=1 Tax=Streptomyces sp. TLI_053 TaxID=1855352 RepID=UPI0008796C11|nr:helicase associated domain-containing protein [Streptomyces sp. TLI_053]SDT83461.1 hypothetical protein SAMN05216371_8292 [Streptomyces sp. TLI_053]